MEEWTRYEIYKGGVIYRKHVSGARYKYKLRITPPKPDVFMGTREEARSIIHLMNTLRARWLRGGA